MEYIIDVVVEGLFHPNDWLPTTPIYKNSLVISTLFIQIPLSIIRRKYTFKNKLKWLLICTVSTGIQLFHMRIHPLVGVCGLFSHILGSRMSVMGVTGGAASGKTSLCRCLRKNDFTIVDADDVAKTIVAPGSVALRLLSVFLGRKILIQGSNPIELDRQALRGLIAEDDKTRTTVNRITHPLILLEILRQVFVRRVYHWQSFVAIDAPLL
eukprot:GHVR01073745.1.p1 GENE.GHVR01073745.1~~GHVR01073745.1.p1  ORF type:complete len:226 (-),score=45.54 GHVR01073745.1:71-703(-)